MSSPDPFRIKYREAVGLVVRSRMPSVEALAALGLRDEDAAKFEQLLARKIDGLAIFNCARYRLAAKETRAWIDGGRPQSLVAFF